MHPTELLCTNTCPCAVVDFTKWASSAGLQTNAYNFLGEIEDMQMCVDYIREQDTNELREILEGLDIEEIQAQTGMTSIADLNNPNDMNNEEAQDAFTKIMEDFLFPIYRVLEGEFDCQGICKPSPFYMTRPIADGPPTSNCMVPLNEYMKDNFNTWGVILLVIFLYLFSLIVWSCCTCRNFEDGGSTNN